MRPEKIQWDGMGNQWNYVCPSCQHEQVLEPAGRNAVLFVVSILVLAFFAVMILMDHWSDWTSWAFWGAACIAFLYFPLNAAWLLKKYPVTDIVEMDVKGDKLNDPIQRGIAASEKMSVMQGLTFPIILIVVVLGLAALYGYVFNP